MKKLVVLGAVCAMLVVPSTAAAAGRQGPVLHHVVKAGAVALSVRDCLSEAREIGRDAFAAKYGTPGALRNCVKQHVDAYVAALESAGQACADERRQLGAEAFRQAYGEPFPFLRCVRSKLNPESVPT
ncbi:MAG: hypothetical protein U0R52_01375 [Solirubrobacterales bacterium]